ASKIADVVANPLERSHQIQHAHITGACVFFAIFGQVEITKGIQPMIKADQDDVAAASDTFTVVSLQLLTRSGRKASAMKPNHNWPLAIIGAGCPHVDAQEVFTRLPIIPFEHERLLIVLPSRAGPL